VIRCDKDFLRFFKRCDHLTGGLPGKFLSSETPINPGSFGNMNSKSSKIIKDHEKFGLRIKETWEAANLQVRI